MFLPPRVDALVVERVKPPVIPHVGFGKVVSAQQDIFQVVETRDGLGQVPEAVVAQVELGQGLQVAKALGHLDQVGHRAAKGVELPAIAKGLGQEGQGVVPRREGREGAKVGRNNLRRECIVSGVSENFI